MSPCNLCSVLKIDKMLLFLITTDRRGTFQLQEVRKGVRISMTMSGGWDSSGFLTCASIEHCPGARRELPEPGQRAAGKFYLEKN